MDLWIRTQRRRLCQVIDISEPILDELDNIEGYCLYGRNLADSFIPLGIYETEKRALEVLDEIQSAIEHKGDCYYKKEEDALYNIYGVYEIPKE